MASFPDITNNLNDSPCLQEGQIICSICSEKLCIREQTLNLALGNTEIMYCLKCLSTKENKNPEELLAKIKKYIMARECFQKEWIKYPNISHCPKSETCFPNTCFAKQ